MRIRQDNLKYKIHNISLTGTGMRYGFQEQFQDYWCYYRALATNTTTTNNNNNTNSNNHCYMFSGRDRIIKSICPQLHGLYVVKLALVLVLISGGCVDSDNVDSGDTNGSNSVNGNGDNNNNDNNDSDNDNRVSRRTQSHILFVGDPGTGKMYRVYKVYICILYVCILYVCIRCIMYIVCMYILYV